MNGWKVQEGKEKGEMEREKGEVMVRRKGTVRGLRGRGAGARLPEVWITPFHSRDGSEVEEGEEMRMNFVVGQQWRKRQVKEVGGRAQLNSYSLTVDVTLTCMHSLKMNSMCGRLL